MAKLKVLSYLGIGGKTLTKRILGELGSYPVFTLVVTKFRYCSATYIYTYMQVYKSDVF